MDIRAGDGYAFINFPLSLIAFIIFMSIWWGFFNLLYFALGKIAILFKDVK